MVEFDDAKCLDTPYELGDFAALGTASSFHKESVRRVQEYAMVESPSHLQLLVAEDPRLKLEQVIDRMFYRLPGRQLSAES